MRVHSCTTDLCSPACPHHAETLHRVAHDALLLLERLVEKGAERGVLVPQVQELRARLTAVPTWPRSPVPHPRLRGEA